MSGIKLKTAGGGSITLQPENTGVDISLTVPADNSMLVSASDLAASGGASLVGYIPGGTGAVATTVQTKLRETVSVKDFGAHSVDEPGYETFDSTGAFNLALAYFAATRTSPTGYTGWGLGRIHIPRGKYLINGTISVASPLGLVFEGDSEFATTLFTTVDNAIMFYFQTYAHVGFEKMAILHTTSTASSTWTNTVFSINGQGGGRNLSLRNLTTYGFQTVIKHNNTINEDTTKADHCTFNYCVTFCDSNNSQAVVNTYTDCTWAGKIDQVFYVGGQQQTIIRSGNVVCDGPLIKFKNISGKYNETGFLLENLKFEWTSANAVAGSKPKIIDANGNLIIARVKMINVSITGGATPNADARFASLGASTMFIEFDNCLLEGLLETTAMTTFSPRRRSYIKFRDSEITIPPSSWSFVAGGAGSGFCPIVFENVRQPNNLHPLNLTLCKTPTVPYVNTRRTQIFGKNDELAPNFYTGSVDTDYPSHGQTIYVHDAKVFVRSAQAQSGRKVELFSDSARTVLVATATLPDTALTNAVVDFTFTGNRVNSNGLYLRTTNGGASTMVLTTMVEYSSI